MNGSGSANRAKRRVLGRDVAKHRAGRHVTGVEEGLEAVHRGFGSRPQEELRLLGPDRNGEVATARKGVMQHRGAALGETRNDKGARKI